MKNGLFFKSFLVTACMFAVCFIVFGVTMLMMGRAFLVREQEKRLYASADEITLLAEAVSLQDGLSSLDLRMSLAAISHANDTHIFLCDADGVVITSSDTAWVSPYIGQILSDGVMAQARSADGLDAVTTLDGFYEERHYVVSRPFGGEDGTEEGFVFVTYAADGFLQVWSGFFVTFLVVALGVLALAVGFQFLYSRRVSRSLREMADAANRFARGDYSARVSPYDEPDELGTLTVAFNSMAESLCQNETRRRDFVANVSHELRTPMTAIAGFADGLLDGTIPQTQERKYLEKISSETKRLSRLVRSMLDMARLRDGDPAARFERFDLSEMVVQTVLNFEDRVTDKHLDVALNMPENRILVRGDVDALTRVVYNLTDNAI